MRELTVYPKIGDIFKLRYEPNWWIVTSGVGNTAWGKCVFDAVNVGTGKSQHFIINSTTENFLNEYYGVKPKTKGKGIWVREGVQLI